MDSQKLPLIHPGEILKKEFFKPLGINQNKLAPTMQVPANRVKAIMNGKRDVITDTSLRLVITLNTSLEFWMNRLCHYDM